VSFLPAFSATVRQRLMFVALCVSWGTTWLGFKVAIAVVPPAFFSGVRWTVAGVLLLGWLKLNHQRVRVPRRLIGRVTVLSIIMISVNATVQLYGLREIASGLAAVISAALTPIATLGFAVALGQERLSWRQSLAFAIGVMGILVLFGPAAVAGRMGLAELLGAGAVAFSTLVWCGSSVASRPLLRVIPPVQMAGISNLIGGVVLLGLSLPFEPGAWHAAGLDWGWLAWASWLWLTFPCSLGASIVYFLLVRDWGAGRTSTYAFVTPVISVLLGMVVLGERMDAVEALGMALMLTGALLALRRGSSARRA
jgi:drug/metabolite transporter (DMT)-like permease